MRKRIATTAATAVFAFAALAPQAFAGSALYQWMQHGQVQSGQTVQYYGETLYASDTASYGAAVSCAGISGYGDACGNVSGGVDAAFVLANNVRSAPYIHNHSGWTGYFDAYWAYAY